MKRAVVIGSGMGGLTSARLLQLAGYAVTVCEQHYRPGGLLHRFHRREGRFDTGFHYCGGVQRGHALGQVLRHLGVWEDLDFHPLDPDGFDRLRFPELELRVPVGWEAYQQRLCDSFPNEARGIAAVVQRLRDAASAYNLYNLRTEPQDLGRLVAVENTTLGSVLREHLSDHRVRAVFGAHGALYGVPPDRAALGVHAVILDHFLAGANTLSGGGDALARALVRRLREDGGTLHLRTRVTAIELDGDVACAVHTDQGERLPADLVVSNLHPQLTLALLPPGAVRRARRTRTLSQRTSPAHMGLYLSVDGPVPELGASNVYRFFRWSGRPTRHRPALYFATAPTEHSPQRRDGPSTVLVVAPMSWESVAPFADSQPDDRPAAYRRLKERRAGQLLAALREDFPTVVARVRSVEASTPLSTVHYTGSPRGAVYGHEHSADQMGRYRPPAFLRTPNVVMVGQGVGLPGVLGTSLSAYYAISRVTERPDLMTALTTAG